MKNWKNVGKWRRTASIILAASMFFGAALGLSGCNAGRQNGVSKKSQDSRLCVVTTIFPYYDFVRQIAGDRVTLKLTAL